MKIIKKYAKKIICIFIRIIIPIVSIFKIRKSNDEILKYEYEIRKLYNPIPYKYKKSINQPNNTKIDLSIIIPVYNSEKYLKECIDSILNNNTKYNYEILCINDGSTDNSSIILEDCTDERIKIITQENRGAAVARNIGLDNAVGKYVAFIDSDDCISDNYIETLMDIAINENIDIVRCGHICKYEKFEKEIKGIQCKLVGTEIRNHITNMPGFLWMSVIKRDLLYDIRLPEGYWYEDMIVRPLILYRCNSYVEIEDSLYFYRQHNNNISKRVEHSKNYKCLSQYYLPRCILRYAQDIKLDIDDNFKLILLKEFELISYTRFSKIPNAVKKYIFYSNSKFIDELKITNIKIENKNSKLYFKSYQQKNYLYFIIISKLIKWGRKNENSYCNSRNTSCSSY